MDIFEFLFPLAVVIIGVVQWVIENRKKAGNGDQRDDSDADLPDWTWPVEEEEDSPPPLPTTPPPAPTQRSRAPIAPPLTVEKKTSRSAGRQGSLSALQQKIAEARKRAQQAEAQRLKYTSKSSPKQKKPATRLPQEVNWLSDPESLRRAIIAREVLGPPLALREGSDIDDR